MYTHKEYMKEYNKKDYVKEKRKLFEQSEKRKQYLKEYHQKNHEKEKEYRKNREHINSRKEYKKQYYKRPEVIERYRKRRNENESYKNYIKEYSKSEKMQDWAKKYRKEYRRKNPHYALKWFMDKYDNEIDFRIKSLLRNRVYISFRLYSETGKITNSKFYGIDYSKIVQHLINTLPKDFSERKYHIDHIIPLSKFNFNDLNEVKKAFAPENHQWLLAEENLRKGAKLIENVLIQNQN